MLILVTERMQLIKDYYTMKFQMPYRKQGAVENADGSGDDYWNAMLQNINVNNCGKQ